MRARALGGIVPLMRWALVLALCACGSSGDDTSSVGTTALFDPAGDDFYALPFPNDLRRHSDGSLDLTGFPAKTPIVQKYVDAAQTLDGFGLNTTIFARFDGPIDPASLPDPAGSIATGASVYLVNLATGVRLPIIVHFMTVARGTVGTNNLSARPYPGFTMDEGATYALVITSRVVDPSGVAVSPASGFQPGDKLTAFLADHPDDVVSAAVFTTQHATQIALALKAGVYAAPMPNAENVVVNNETPFTLVTGQYDAPNFQVGDVPYTTTGGQIVVGADGVAVAQRTERLRFAMTVPNNVSMPTSGWPIALYQHGTGGDWMSFIDDGTAQRLTAQGLAVISMDQVLHGPRNPGGDPEVSFFNPQNPQSIRDNIMQGTADAYSQLRLAVGMAIPNGSDTIKIDPTKVYFFGHSQGSETGPGFVATAPSLKGAVLSGCSGLVYMAVIYKTMPTDIAAAVETLIRDEPYDEDNPTLALLQMWMEHSDPVNYARLMVREPLDGIAPRNIFQSEGFTDTFAPNPGIEAFATAIGGDIVQTVDEKDVEGITLRGRQVLAPPFSNNIGGTTTAVLAQYKQKANSDGHFVVFEVPAAEKQSAQFLGTLAATGTATVVAP